eukprot:2460069-Rhodomonas_salina.1
MSRATEVTRGAVWRSCGAPARASGAGPRPWGQGGWPASSAPTHVTGHTNARCILRTHVADGHAAKVDPSSRSLREQTRWRNSRHVTFAPTSKFHSGKLPRLPNQLLTLEPAFPAHRVHTSCDGSS